MCDPILVFISNASVLLSMHDVARISIYMCKQGRTDNSWGPRAIGDHGAPVPLPKIKKAYQKGTRGISWGPLLTEFPNGQSTAVHR
ncbi:unnamed protein product [Staurois parvus]|uniref:Uncharacterized protein n=1 Tax=Staurois parvus TaxID=386267 RepID=A0ABN9GAY8_9NEOB|nr:unnamed protein product [Staurois parvus]